MMKSAGNESRLHIEHERLCLGLDLVDTNVMVCDNDMTIVFANRKVLEMFSESEEKIARDYPGFRADSLIGTNLSRYHAQPHRQGALLKRISEPYVSNIRFGGEIYRIVVNPIDSAAGERLGAIVEWQNLTAEALKREEDERRRRQVERILEGLGDLRLVIAADGIIVDVNAATVERLGYRRDDLVGASLDKLLPEGTTAGMFGALAVDNVVRSMRTTLAHAGGHAVPVNLFGVVGATTTRQSEFGQIILLARLARARDQQDSALPLSEYLSERISDGVAVVDGSWSLLSANRPFCQIVDADAEQLIGARLTEVLPGIDDFATRPADASWQREYEGQRGEGDRYTVILSVHALGHGSGSGPNRLVTIKDITTVKETERQMRELAYRDTLTGLANRMYFEHRVNDSIKIARRKKQRFAILFFDLDGFKDVNDSLGHDAGDQLLCLIADRLCSNVRESDLVARLGGDEFCVLLEDVQDATNASRVAEKCLRDLSEPCVIRNRELQPMASIGITLFPDDGASYAELLRAADTAMYVAKHGGKNRHAFYSPEMTRAAQERLRTEHELRAALRNNEFVVHYQPQVSLHSGMVTGVESLVRWEHPRRGLLPPNEFIPALERERMIEDLGVIVLETACRQLKAWQDEGIGELLVGVNISGLHFQSGRIVHHVRRVIDETGIDPALLELEVTESVIQTADRTLETCEALKEIGVKLALDDFGTGFSCLDSMRRLPLDRLKIDRLFVRDLMADPGNASIVATIIAMSRAMGMQVVAEGVEELEQIQYLIGLGCEIGQGFYFSRPVGAAQIPPIAAQSFLPAARARQGEVAVGDSG